MEKSRVKDGKGKSGQLIIAKTSVSVPEDFMISIHSVPRIPGSPAPSLFLNIKANGEGKYYETADPRDRKYKLLKKFTISPNAIKEIYQTVHQERFFDLKPEYRDHEVLDGDYAEIEIRANGRTYRVRTVNIKVGAFDRIVMKVNELVPKYATIYYNALSTDKYKKVER